MKAPSKPGKDYLEQRNTVERGNRNSQPPGRTGEGMTTSPRPKPKPNKDGMTTSPRPKARPERKTTPRGPAKPRNV